MMPTIVGEYKDSELVDLVLFKLPWLCYGLKQGLKVTASGAISVKKSSTLGSTYTRNVADLGSVNNSSLNDAGISRPGSELNSS